MGWQQSAAPDLDPNPALREDTPLVICGGHASIICGLVGADRWNRRVNRGKTLARFV